MDIYINTIRTEDISMQYMRFGTGPKTMVILPGISVKSVILSADAVANQYKSMTEDFTIYLLDRREDLPSRYTVEDMASDTAKILKELSLSDIYLFGASQGGMISLVIAARYPGLVKKLAVGSTCPKFEGEYPAIEKWIELAKEHKGVELFLDFASKLYPESMAESLNDFLVSTGKTVTDEEFLRFVTLAEGTYGFDISESLSDINCPVLILGSEDDAVVGPQGSYRIYNALSPKGSAFIHMYDGLGHASFDTAADYRDRLTSFFLEEPDAG